MLTSDKIHLIIFDVVLVSSPNSRYFVSSTSAANSLSILHVESLLAPRTNIRGWRLKSIPISITEGEV